MLHNSGSLGKVKFMQLVLIHKLIEDYEPADGPASKIPAVWTSIC